ncbi:MAG: flagellar motor switch protein FliN [Candidatus Solibacter usitatus]|nr:flagellar motor switch protein FliN [Candidatus Solibacter usitatus]
MNKDTAPEGSGTLELLMDLELPVNVSFGKTQMPLQQVLKWTTGSIIELENIVNDPVDIVINHCVIARGEVVVVEGNYGVRVQEIVSRAQRLQTSAEPQVEE